MPKALDKSKLKLSRALTVLYELHGISDSESSSDEALFLLNDLDDEEVVSALMREEHPRQKDFMQTIQEMSDHDFWRHFRVSRSTFAILLSEVQVEGFRSNIVWHGGPLPIENDEILYMCLSYIGTQCSLNTIAMTFGRSEASVWHAVDAICDFFFSRQAKYIKLPKKDELHKIAEGFRKKAGFPGIVAAFDGVHFRFHPPSEQVNAYRNYKKFYSFVAIAGVLSDKTCCYFFCGHPGSSHDSFIFQRSGLYQKLELDANWLFDATKYHFIGDSGFQLKDWMMVPYKKPRNGQLGASHRIFNGKLSCSRVVVEICFGDLKNRFRRLIDFNTKLEKSVQIAVTSVCINNICIRNGDLVTTEISATPRSTARDNSIPVNIPGGAGYAKRERIRSGFIPFNTRRPRQSNFPTRLIQQ